MTQCHHTTHTQSCLPPLSSTSYSNQRLERAPRTHRSEGSTVAVEVEEAEAKRKKNWQSGFPRSLLAVRTALIAIVAMVTAPAVGASALTSPGRRPPSQKAGPHAPCLFLRALPTRSTTFGLTTGSLEILILASSNLSVCGGKEGGAGGQQTPSGRRRGIDTLV